MRLFAAVPLPASAVERLTSLRLRLSAPKDGIRWSEPEQWHVTVQFYGELDPGQAACLQEQLARLVTAAPCLRLEQLGTFATKGILYVSVEQSAGLEALHRECLEKSRACGVVPESRPFRPHITLARSKGKAGDRTLQRLSKPTLPAFGAPIQWTAQECLLLESTLRPQGAAYRVVARLPLGTSVLSEQPAHSEDR